MSHQDSNGDGDGGITDNVLYRSVPPSSLERVQVDIQRIKTGANDLKILPSRFGSKKGCESIGGKGAGHSKSLRPHH
jgi:hypothetical protein